MRFRCEQHLDFLPLAPGVPIDEGETELLKLPGDQLDGGAQTSNPRASGGCGFKAHCARGNFRRITRWEGEAVLDRMAIGLAARPGILDIRRETVEYPLVQSSNE